MSNSQGFALLDQKIQQWIWKQNWTALRDIQEQAIPFVLNRSCDIVISASTASGKTEAAFLPACSRLVENLSQGIGILYISPLKALINDQHRRLESLGELLGISITSWHGDALESKKNNLRKNPEGILLITPESLESLVLHHSGWCVKAFSNLNHIIIDEFHSFIGTERGIQLLSLMHRLEFLSQRLVPRIALSATLGDMQQVAKYLRPQQNFPCKIIESSTSRADLKIQLRGYLYPAYFKENSRSAFDLLTEDLYKILRGKSNLVFANSRGLTEEITANLTDRCNKNGVPNEFFPHHGNLSKDIRENLEKRLQDAQFPTTAICTMTLELGIDIGTVDSIAQITAPNSVASLRQRLGRSGRREDPAVLRVFLLENEISANTHLIDKLRLETIQTISMINLLLKKWYEPPEKQQYHLSTLIQQTISVIGQYGGVRANQLWALLCKNGPFHLVDPTTYEKLLKDLGKEQLISQTQEGEIILGSKGEQLIEHYSFYTAFNTTQEYRLECDGRALGTIPLDDKLFEGQLIIFAGKRWKILDINVEKKLITLKPSLGGKSPLFHGGGQMVHAIVREEMYRIYTTKELPVYLNSNGVRLFEEGVDFFHTMKLDGQDVIQDGSTTFLFPWKGDRTVNTISVLLRNQNLTVGFSGGVIEIAKCPISELKETIAKILKEKKLSTSALANTVANTNIEKHDHYLSQELRALNYGGRAFDIDEAWSWLETMYTKILNN
ncbi:DEAD/DEAH box helicase [Legionella sp. km535]|uniref:DEAD/DEAH box helicase n=1 Tax=Legionella sp. km535 TaxID=2498107 RepID=UPI000F8DED6B|nr:DEAD/DEAH box helicase [Legionella sp. km535]RUR18217.1 DEAD/DEAH box helicase [Legionella sp. km535]